MQRISSRMTFFYKRVFPLVWFGFLLLSIAVPLAKDTVPPLPVILIPIAMIGFGYLIMKKLVFDLADEVWDAGDMLIVRNRDREDRILLSDIMNVSASQYTNPPRITLMLRMPSVFGDDIAFSPPVSLNPFASRPMIDDLIRRVDDARRRKR